MAGLKEWPDSNEGRTKTKAGLRLFHHLSSHKKTFWNLMCHWGSRDPRSTLPTTHQYHTLQSDKNFLKKTQRVQPEKNLDKWERNPETKLARTTDQGGLFKITIGGPLKDNRVIKPKRKQKQKQNQNQKEKQGHQNPHTEKKPTPPQS